MNSNFNDETGCTIIIIVIKTNCINSIHDIAAMMEKVELEIVFVDDVFDSFYLKKVVK